MAESLFYRLKNPNRDHPDNVTEDELQEIGIEWDRLVRFMDKDDPNYRHPHDQFGSGDEMGLPRPPAFQLQRGRTRRSELSALPDFFCLLYIFIFN